MYDKNRNKFADSSFFRNLLIAIFCISIFSCQTSPLKDFSTLKLGMEKGEVLETMGSPNRTQRFHGKDRWTYIFYDKDVRYEKEVHLEGGRTVYVGDVWNPSPEKSAETADSQNESAHNAYIEEMENKSKENKNKSFSDYEKRAKGEDKVRYLPTYKKIK